MLPIRRDLKFPLPADRILDWHPRGEHVSQFFNTMSLFFPIGERFFIQAVRHYRDRVKDPELQKAMTAFIGQEAMHGREHEEYNELSAAAGQPAVELEQRVAKLLEFVKRNAPPSFQLGATIALEHYTAILADILLRDPRIIEGADPAFRDLWNWHALEETEHKAVAWDVFEAAVGKDAKAYAIRSSAMVVATVIFWTLVYRYQYEMMKAKGRHRDVRGWLGLLWFQWGFPGGLRRNVLPWLDYFRPGFHPWQHDNAEFLSRIPEIAARNAPVAIAAA